MQLSARTRVASLTLFWAAVLPVPFAHAEGQQHGTSDAAVEKRETRAWLTRIQDAANKRSYQGTVIVSSGGAVASSRIVHHCEGRDQFERIDALDGQPRHVVRQNDRVHTVWPQKRVAMVEQRDRLSSFPGLLQPGNEQIADFYELKASGVERVAGHEANVLTLRPRDALRYGYRLWADKESGLLLRTEVLGDRGVVLESSSFSDVVVGGHPSVDAMLQPIRKLDGYKTIHPVSVATRLDAEGWRFNAGVPGFQVVSCVKRSLDAPLRPQQAASAPRDEPLLQTVLSDGITYVTVFIEPYSADRHTRAVSTAIGATQTLMRRQGDWWITMMGDVPAPTLRLFADALERRK